MTDRRVRLVRVNLQTYVEMMKQANSTVEFTGDFMPADAQVVGINEIAIVVQSAQFSPIPDYDPVPILRGPVLKIEERPSE